MSSDIAFGAARVYAIPMRARFPGITIREGMLIEGPAGWGEFCPFADYDDRVSASWLATMIEQCTVGWPEPVRDRIPINCTVPAVSPQRAHDIAARSGCHTAKVKVADHPESLSEDLARVEAVRDALGSGGLIRVDANGVWDIDTAVSHIRRLDKVAVGLEYVEQPCRTIEELAAVRRQVDVRIAADESSGITLSSVLGTLKGINPSYHVATIPASTYPSATDTPTIVTPNLLLVPASMDSATACVLTTTVFEHTANLVKINPAAAGITLQQARQTDPVPLHPGAKQALDTLGAPWSSGSR